MAERTTVKPATGEFNESEMSAVLKEEEKTQKQKGVFVFKGASQTAAETKPGIEPATPAEATGATIGAKTPETTEAATQKTETSKTQETQTSAQIAQTTETSKTPETKEPASDLSKTEKTEGKVGEISKNEAEKALAVIESKGNIPTQAEIQALQKAEAEQKPEHEISSHEVSPKVSTQATVTEKTALDRNITTGATAGTMVPFAPETHDNQQQALGPSSTEVQEMTKQINKTLDALSKLNQQTEGNLNQVKYLDAYAREVSLNVEKLNTQVVAMDSRIQSLSNLANSLSKDLGKVRNEVGYAKRVATNEDNLDVLSPPPRKKGDCGMVMDEGGDCSGGYAAPRKPARVCAGPEEPEYVVHAVIPGRAWLKSCKGQILTVTEGETVGNYGKVLVIDASNSIVLTSSGIAFR